MQYLDIAPIHHVAGVIDLPGSKSISNRVLLLAALAQGTSQIKDLLHSDDTHYLLTALTQLGIRHQVTEQYDQIIGCQGRFPIKKAHLFLGNAGTAFRPLTSILSFMQGHYQLSADIRMTERPIQDLVNALHTLGARITYLNCDGYPPLKIAPDQWIDCSEISIQSHVSSQFLTALLLALPLLKRAVTIRVLGQLISKPYIAMTLQLMTQFGVFVSHDNWQNFYLTGQDYYQSPGIITIESDATSASYFLAAGAIAGGQVTIRGVGQDSIQGDIYFAKVLEKMGAQISWTASTICVSPTIHQKLQAISLDLNDMPDAAMTLAVTALFAQGTTVIRNIASWRVKETDRLTAMATELRKVGAIVKEGIDYLTITPPEKLISATIETYNDHRMAMCFSLVALAGIPIRINNPGCVNKTFPHYFKAFSSLVSL